jgi:hypothetical protein
VSLGGGYARVSLKSRKIVSEFICRWIGIDYGFPDCRLLIAIIGRFRRHH